MKLDVKQFLLLNGILILVIAVSYFFKGSRRTRPAKLDMRAGNGKAKKASKDVVVQPAGGRSSQPPGRATSGSRSDSLNVIFNYNGHSWDAHEALGIPAGASRSMVEAAYKKAMSEVDPESRAFIETAYKSIINR